MTEAFATQPTRIETRCCIAGGGPAGMMLGFLLARAGVEVVVLEKHGDFLRDFRGDTIHPSTLELMHELGLLDAFLERPHTELSRLSGIVGDEEIPVADLTHLPTHCKFIALMPQWDFLDFLAEHARAYPAFRLMMRTEATDLVEDAGRIVGLRATTQTGPIEIRADLVVGCDGRHSTVRARAGLPVEDLGAPIDVLWFRVSRRPDDPNQALGRFAAGKIMVTIDRGDYWQCAFVIPKDGIAQVQARGLPAFRASVEEIVPGFAGRTGEIDSWDAVKLLTVAVDRLTRWHRPGLLCIGDAAHAMSPIGGVGINLAIQDAVAAANILAGPLGAATLRDADLEAVQTRRMLPTRLTQGFQVFVQNQVISRALAAKAKPRTPFVLRLLKRLPVLRRVPARLVGLGVRPEHVRTPDAAA
jgi:2-polyprenyl-6-methoxyphenol hydroxylase-like FAD-dependent oxidoreductase